MGPWRGELIVGDCTARWRGSIGDAAPHRHYAAQAIFSDEPLRVWCGGTEVIGHCILIEPNAFHRVGSGGDADLYFVEPKGRKLKANDLGRRIDTSTAIIVGDEQSVPFWRACLALPEQNPLEPRILTTVDRIDALLGDGAVRLTAVSAASGLSHHRLRRLFAAEIGMPFQRYVLWRRVRLAAVLLNGGSSVTEAAHGAGFADSAHLARTLKAMFGVRATDAFQPLRSSRAARSPLSRGYDNVV